MNQRKQKPFRFLKALFHHLMVIAGAMSLTLLFFLVLPLMQTLAKPPATDLVVMNVDTGNLEAPPPAPESEPEPEPEPEEAPPELGDEPQQLVDLSMLEIALNPGVSGGWMEGDFAVKLNTMISSQGDDAEALFSIADLDQKPRAIYQPGPIMNEKLRKGVGGTVYIIFIVNRKGRVQNPRIQSSPDSIYDKAALNAIKKWKFEPGKRNGKPVRFRMRVPFTFPKG